MYGFGRGGSEGRKSNKSVGGGREGKNMLIECVFGDTEKHFSGIISCDANWYLYGLTHTT